MVLKQRCLKYPAKKPIASMWKYMLLHEPLEVLIRLIMSCLIKYLVKIRLANPVKWQLNSAKFRSDLISSFMHIKTLIY